MHYFFLLILGVAGGIIGGTFGVGGGIIIVPILVMAFGLSQHLAQGTMLSTLLLPSFALAVWAYYKEGNVNIPFAIVLSVGMMLGAVLGAKYAHTIPPPMLKKAFGVLMILAGLKLMFFK